jgi:hypothetical protein
VFGSQRREGKLFVIPRVVEGQYAFGTWYDYPENLQNAHDHVQSELHRQRDNALREKSSRELMQLLPGVIQDGDALKMEAGWLPATQRRGKWRLVERDQFEVQSGYAELRTCKFTTFCITGERVLNGLMNSKYRFVPLVEGFAQ